MIVDAPATRPVGFIVHTSEPRTNATLRPSGDMRAYRPEPVTRDDPVEPRAPPRRGRTDRVTIFASGAATAGIQALAGPAGTGLVILVFVILGNSASGGPFARPLLPGLWSTIGGVLPPGASVDLARSALFFDGARIAGPVLVLVIWAALGTVLALALGGRMMDPVATEAEAAAGAAV
jgi:hypothetical protein